MGASNLEGIISDTARSLLQGRQNLVLLEAGCGSASYFQFASVARSVGIDISREQLDRNTAVQEKILGDLQTYPLPADAFDIAVCWDVVEHLPRPREALMNLFNSIKPGGVLILGFPNLFSFKGLVTKCTPFWFHELFYRTMRYRGPHFPTYLRCAILPNRVLGFARRRGFEAAFQRFVEGGVTKRFKQRYPVLGAALLFLDWVAKMAFLGKRNSLFLDNCAFIFVKTKAVSSHNADPVNPHAVSRLSAA